VQTLCAINSTVLKIGKGNKGLNLKYILKSRRMTFNGAESCIESRPILNYMRQLATADIFFSCTTNLSVNFEQYSIDVKTNSDIILWYFINRYCV
jgi:hypothetical protein